MWGLEHKAIYCLSSEIAFVDTLLLSLSFACVHVYVLNTIYSTCWVFMNATSIWCTSKKFSSLRDPLETHYQTAAQQ